MALNLTEKQIDDLWDQGYRPFEIYTCNPKPVIYYGEYMESGEVKGWEIQFIFAKRESLVSYPFFDCVIGMDSVAACDTVWHGPDNKV